jgi:sigma-E factor negative regulatory protein RseC
MNKIAQVVKIENNIATIKVARASACGENCASCGSHCTEKGHFIEVTNQEYELGQLLEVTTKDQNILAFSAIAYGIPLLVMVGTILLVYQLAPDSQKDAFSAIAGVLSLSVSFFLLRLLDRFLFKKTKMIEKITPYRGG